jgi:hypothetical protein
MGRVQYVKQGKCVEHKKVGMKVERAKGGMLPSLFRLGWSGKAAPMGWCEHHYGGVQNWIDRLTQWFSSLWGPRRSTERSPLELK